MKLYVIRHGETNMGKKKLIATEEEQKENSRSTCAKLRVVEKII